MVSFQQILKVGENIKIDICKCPINVELVKKSSNRPGHLQMPFQIHLLLCELAKMAHIDSNRLILAQFDSD